MKLNKIFITFSFFFTYTFSQSIQLYNFTTANSGFSSTCVAVLNQAVACDVSLKWAGGHRYEDDATLANLCTTTCNTALSTWLRRTAGACTTRFVGSNGDAILPAYWVEKVVEKYNVVCLKNGVSFCNAVLRDVLGINPVDQKQTKSAATTATCDECLLKRMQTQLQMPLLSNPDLATTFTSLTKKCSKTGFAVTTPAVTTQYVTKGAPPTTSVGVPTPTAGSCIGTKYTIKTGDTCQSVSLAQGLSTADLLIQNNLQAFCVNFPTAGSLCIPTEAKCKTYTVKTGDKCASIADANKLTWTQMVTWNPNFGQGCESIGKFTGWTACVSNPGGDWINPSPTSEITLSTLIPTIHGTFAGLLPKPTFGGFLNGSDTWAYKYADKTRLDCWIYANGTQFGTSTSCADVAKGYGVTTQNLTDWNPSLLSNGCMLDGKLTYCVQPMKLNATKYTQYCVLSDTPEYGLTCADFMAAWSLDFEDFSGWNPGVGAACENWVLGREYCVVAKHFRQPGIVSTCNQYAMANVSNSFLNPCDIIETKFGLQHARFVAWNPAVNVNCTNLRYGYDYCVSIPNYKPTYTSKIYTYATTPLQIPSLDISDDLALPTPGTIAVITSGSSVSVESKATSKTTALVTSSVKSAVLGSSLKSDVATGSATK